MRDSLKLVCVALLIPTLLERPTAAREPYWPEDRPRAKEFIRPERSSKITGVDSHAASLPPLNPEYVAASEDGDLSSPAGDSKGDRSTEDADKKAPKRPPRPPRLSSDGVMLRMRKRKMTRMKSNRSPPTVRTLPKPAARSAKGCSRSKRDTPSSKTGRTEWSCRTIPGARP